MPVILIYTAAVKSFDPNINNICVYCESLDCIYGNWGFRK